MAAFTKTYADVSWSSGQYITQAKMRQEADNDTYLRDQFEGTLRFDVKRINYVTEDNDTLLTYAYRRYNQSLTGMEKIGIDIGGTLVQATATSGNISLINLDISSEVTYPTGATTVTVGIWNTAETTRAVSVDDYNFIKTQECKKVSFFSNWIRNTSGTDYIYVYDYSIIFHRETYSW